MSFRLFTNRLFKNGRYFLQCYCKRDIYTNILEHGRNRSLAVSLPKTGGQNVKVAIRNYPSGIFRLGQHARKLFIDNILNRVTTTYCADLRTKAVKKLFYGDSAPFFALIGVSLASGAGVLTKEDELEGVCWEIREAANRIQNLWNSEDISKTIDDSFNIDQLDVGPPIAKGCAAVVYAASFKNDNQSESSFHGNEEGVTPIRIGQQYGTNNNYRPELMSPLQNMSRFVHNFGGSVDNLHICNQGISLSGMFGTVPGWRNVGPNDTTTTGNHPNSASGSKRTSLNEDGIWRVNSASERLIEDIESIQASEGTVYRYPLALKMMFNYDIQSNALSILRAMYKETIPARKRLSSEEASEWEKLIQDQTLTLAPHPNIVLMFGYFCGEVRNFRDGHILYPVAQPPRINPQGYGRNMSLYLLMKRYDCSLNAYLNSDGLNSRTRILLFAQLLEAITHLNRHGVAHRDLKSDNILIELNDDNSPPLLVLSDFGCCLADKVHGLQIPYNSFDIDKGGNAALMAPEIMNKTPGTFSVLNYSKSDLWACGAIGYEIFGERNPFYARSDLSRLTTSDKGEDEKPLRNVDYQEIDLPTLGDNCPHIVQELIYNILNPNPNKRLSPDIAANVMQLYLWAPSAWLKSGGMPSSPEVLQWLLSLTTKIMCEGKHGNTMSLNDLDFKMGRRTYVEYVLICSFLARARLRRIRGALTWIQTVV